MASAVSCITAYRLESKVFIANIETWVMTKLNDATPSAFDLLLPTLQL